MSTISYKELLRQRAELDLQIKEAHSREIASVVTQVRELVAQYQLSEKDVFPATRGRPSSDGVAKVAPKYRNPATGQTWTGRGKPPQWIKSADRTQFLIREPQPSFIG